MQGVFSPCLTRNLRCVYKTRMANFTAGDGPQYDERNPSCGEEGHYDGCPHQDDLCAHCGDEFGWTYLVGTNLYRCERLTPSCALCGRVCVACHEAMHEDAEIALAARGVEDGTVRASDLPPSLAEAVQRRLGL